MSGLFLGATPDGGADFSLPADRLRTHGVVLGMTGSGKTGLCLVLLEELVRAGVPIIALDPKGDLSNLGLLFGDFTGNDFAPWVGRDDDPARVALRWKAGVARSGLGSDDVAALARKLSLRVFTPGSTAATPVDVLGALRRPAPELLADTEARADLVRDTVSGLLGLIGKESDPVRDPAHIVLSTVLDHLWASGADPDLETLILQLVDPPFSKVGVFPLDRFFSPDDRMDLAMALNGVVAAPGFAPWKEGAPLDVEALLTVGSTVPVNVFHLAHLDESQRAFFVSMLLSRVLAWSRSQPGTEGLRALVFFDEVAGYLPPHPGNPASKGPLLTLMKQARAVGLGVVLATQNPVDLDYKALSNAGVWAIGRLQTPQDRDRVLKGIGAPGLDDVVQGLEKRQFLVHQVGRGAPTVIGTRHAMCYLRGPFTRADLERLQARQVSDPALPPLPRAARAAPPPVPAAVPPLPQAAPPAPVADDLLPVPPTVPGVARLFLDPRVAFSARLDGVFAAHAGPARADGATAWAPALYAHLRLRFDEEQKGFVHDLHERRVWYPLRDRLPSEAVAVDLEETDLLPEPPAGGRFAPLPDWMDEEKELAQLRKSIVDSVYRSESAGMWAHPQLRLYGKGGESKEDFTARVQQAIDDRVDSQIAKEQEKVRKRVDRLEDRIRKKEAKLVELEGAAKARKVAEAVNLGETLLSFFGGRKKSLSSAVTKRRMAATAASRVSAAEQDIADLHAQAADLAAELEDREAAFRDDGQALLDHIEERRVRLEKNDIQVHAFGVLWVPVTRRL